MAYDRYDTRRGREGSRYSDYERGRRDERGFFERAGDEIASWFGDDEAERRRREDERMHGGHGRDFDRDRYAFRGSGRSRFEDEERASRPMSDRDYRSTYAGYERDFSPRGYGTPGIERGYSPGYVGGFERGGDRPGSSWSRGEYRRGDAGSPHDSDRSYQAWRQRQLDDLDRDYDEYRRENQERFKSDFGSWRQTRQQKRGLLGRIREHMDVVGSDGETVGKVDCVRGDRVVLTKSDSEDNRHHSIKCSMIDTVEGDQVRLDIPAEEAKSRFRDEDERGFFGRGEENESVNLERSFAGTYR